MAEKEEEKKEIVVRGQVRNSRGKNDSRRLRVAGLVPLTIYGGDGDAVAAAAPLSELAAILRSKTGHNTIFTLELEGAEGGEVLFHDRQIDPVRGRLIHADLRRLVRGQKTEVSVPLVLTGTPAGVKEGGVLEQIVREVIVRCRPRHIPGEFSVDVSGLNIHDVLHIKDLPADENLEMVDDPDTVLATVGFITEADLELETTTPEEPAA